jgi:hypothetical protein
LSGSREACSLQHKRATDQESSNRQGGPMATAHG